MLCRLCKKADESLDHIVSGCSKLAEEEYKRRHDKLKVVSATFVLVCFVC